MKTRPLAIWGIGFALSCLFIWCVTAIFSNSAKPRVHDPFLDDVTFYPGTTIIVRNEGWGDTHIGEHGFLKGEDALALSDVPKFMLWGDSHIEAFQVDDKDKTSTVYNTLSKGRPYACISNGRANRSVADYHFLIPKYEKALANVRGNVILLNGLDDITPLRQKSGYGQFIPIPLSLKENPESPSPNERNYGRIIRALRLGPYYSRYYKLKTHHWNLMPSTTAAARKDADFEDTAPSPELEKAWRFLLNTLKRHDGFLVFIYCPLHAPSLVGGQVTLTDDEAARVRLFKGLCEKVGVGFIDMSDAFTELYKRENSFPRGFFNSPPGQGHLNEKGQRLIAKALLAYLREAGR